MRLCKNGCNDVLLCFVINTVSQPSKSSFFVTETELNLLIVSKPTSTAVNDHICLRANKSWLAGWTGSTLQEHTSLATPSENEAHYEITGRIRAKKQSQWLTLKAVTHRATSAMLRKSECLNVRSKRLQMFFKLVLNAAHLH